MTEEFTGRPNDVAAGVYLRHITQDRHPATSGIARWFAYDHLPAGLPFAVSAKCAALACEMVEELPDGPELTAGLRKLLEAKDCLVRAAIAAGDPQ
jgi:hypothetical protein